MPTEYNLQQLVQGDEIVMSCIASKYKYHKVTWYKRNSRTNETTVFEKSDAVEYKKTEFRSAQLQIFKFLARNLFTFFHKIQTSSKTRYKISGKQK